MINKKTVFESESAWLEKRTSFITSTEVACLFGLNPYKSLFQLWHEKREGFFEAQEETNAIKTGRYFEDGICRMVGDDMGWTIEDREPWEIYEHPTIPRLASSYDRVVVCPKRGDGLLEAKCRDKYAFDETYTETQIPAECEIQLQVEMMCSGYEWACHAVFVLQRRDYVLFFRRADFEVQKAIERAVVSFWESIAKNTPPRPDYDSVSDREFILSRLPSPVCGSRKDFTMNNELPVLCADYKHISGEISLLSEKREALKVRILEIVGAAERVDVQDGWSVTSKIIQKDESIIPATAYRGFRIDRKKPKTERN